jgi:chromosome segregation ATPase
MKDIADLLEEVHTLVQALREEKMILEDRLKTAEGELSRVDEAKKSLIRDLQETKEKLEQELQATKKKLDHVYPEMQSLQHELQNAEVQNNLLTMDLKRKDTEIKALELQLREYTSLIPTSFHMKEPIG